MPTPATAPTFDYDRAFSRNIGWITAGEQHLLAGKRIAIGGLGGVGGSHLIALVRLGIANFTISDLDDFDWPNFNRQAGAGVSTIGQAKLAVMERMARDINPGVSIRSFPDGIQEGNIDAFLEGASLYVDSLDIFAVNVRRRVFARCRELGIPAITAAPMGMGTSILVFHPKGMSFEDYFDLAGRCLEEQLLRFIVGVSPTMMQRHYLVDSRSVDLKRRNVPSTIIGIELAAGFAATQSLKLLLGRGKVPLAPHGMHVDAYLNRMVTTWRPGGNRNPLQRLMIWYIRRRLQQAQPVAQLAV